MNRFFEAAECILELSKQKNAALARFEENLLTLQSELTVDNTDSLEERLAFNMQITDEIDALDAEMQKLIQSAAPNDSLVFQNLLAGKELTADNSNAEKELRELIKVRNSILQRLTTLNDAIIAFMEQSIQTVKADLKKTKQSQSVNRYYTQNREMTGVYLDKTDLK